MIYNALVLTFWLWNTFLMLVNSFAMEWDFMPASPFDRQSGEFLFRFHQQMNVWGTTGYVGQISSAVEIQVTFRSNEFSPGLSVFTAFSSLEMRKCKKDSKWCWDVVFKCGVFSRLANRFFVMLIEIEFCQIDGRVLLFYKKLNNKDFRLLLVL